MDGKTPRKPKPPLRRRLLRVLLAGLACAALLVAVTPWLLGTAPVRSAAVSAANRALAPSRVGVRGISASWVGPITLTGLTLRNAQGKTLIAARRASLHRGLIGLALNRTRLGTLTVEDADVDIERRADGSIDLVDALVPPSPAKAQAQAPAPTARRGGPAIELELRVTSGTLRLTTPELAEPLVAGSVALEATLPARAGAPLSWKLRLAKPPGGTEAETLGLDGSYDYQAATDPALALRVHGERWPFRGGVAGVAAQGRLVGGLTLDHKGGALKTAGDARLLDLEATGPAFAGDTLRFDSVGGVWDLSEGSEGWSIRKLDLKAPVASLRATGAVTPDGSLPSAHLDGALDLAALSKQIPHTLRLREGLALERGSATLSLDLTSAGGTQTAALDARVTDLAAKKDGQAFTLRDAATVNAKGSRSPTGFAVDSLRVKTAFLDAQAKGDLASGLTLSGVIDLAAIEAQFRDLIDFNGVELAGKGRMAGDYRKAGATFVARYAAELRGLKVAGLTAEPFERDALRFDVAANGPLDPAGLPTGLDVARVHLKSSRDGATVTAQFRPETIAVNAVASTPLTVSAREGLADAKVVGTWQRAASRLDLDELRLGLRPTDPALVEAGTLAFAARGVLDLKADELALTPLPGAPDAPLALAPEGMKLHGLKSIPLTERAARVPVAGDLGALDRALTVWYGTTPYGLIGAFHGWVGMGPGDPGKLNVGADLNVPDFSRLADDGKTYTPEGALTLACRASYEPGVDRVDFSKLLVVSRYARVEAEGRITEPTGRRLADLKGTITPDWRTFNGMLASAVEPNARVHGNPRAFSLAGPLWEGSLAATLQGLDAEVGLDLLSADAFGMKLGPAPVVVRCAKGSLTVDPIVSTLNGGKVELKPGLEVDEAKGITLLLSDGTAVTGAQINDEVSRRVLRYVAPVLDKATHVTGKVSLTVAQGMIPLSGPPERTMTLKGQLVFDDVNFAPGPFANQVLTVAGKANSPGLKLHQPVNLSIADSRVVQKGLEIPIRGDASLGLEGSVGFDQTLDLRASIPLTKGMLGGAAVAGLDELVAGNRVTVPIGGTVSDPKINRKALQVALRELTKGMVKRGLNQEANGLLNKLGVPPIDGGGAGAGANPGTAADPARAIEDQILKRLLPPRGRSGRAVR